MHRTSLPAACVIPFLGPLTHAADAPLEQVIVTARKVSEAPGTVPLAIDVFDHDRLVAASVDDLEGLARLAPGLYFESLWGGLGSAPVLRGQSQPSTAGDNVGVFVDGVYQAARTAIDVWPLDIERIEVARGPQSTLFGHSTFAGAIHYVPRAATAELTSGAELAIGSDRYGSASGFISGPLPGNVLRGRLAAGLQSAAGTWQDASSGDSLGDAQRAAVTASLDTATDDAWQARLSARWSDSRTSHPPSSTVDLSQYNCGAIDRDSGTWSYYCGPLPVSRRIDLSSDLPDSQGTVSQASLSITWSGPTLTFASDTSYYRGESNIYRDFDATSRGETYGVCAAPDACPRPGRPPVPVTRLVQVNAVAYQAPRAEEWTQEFRLSGSAGRQFRWLVGATGYHTRERAYSAFGFERGDLSESELLTVLLPASPQVAGPVARANRALVEDPNRAQIPLSLSESTRRTLAFFGTLDYRPTAAVGLRAELRATQEHLEVDSKLANFGPGLGTSLPEQRFTDVTPRFSVDLRTTSGGFWYASAAKGSRSGGINDIPGLRPAEQGFEPEYNWTYELGGRLEDPELQWNGGATLYYIDWRNTQLIGFATTPGISNLITRNTAGVTTRGIELAMQARLRPAITARGAYSYADPQFKSGSDDPGSGPFCGLTDGNLTSSFCTVGPSRSGNAPPGSVVPYVDGKILPRAPRTQWQLGLQTEAPPSQGGWRTDAAVDLSYQGDLYDRAVNGARYGQRTLLSARLRVRKDAWSIELWGTNLTNDAYIRAVASRGAAFYPVTPRPLDPVYGGGRRWGLTLRYER